MGIVRNILISLLPKAKGFFARKTSFRWKPRISALPNVIIALGTMPSPKGKAAIGPFASLLGLMIKEPSMLSMYAGAGGMGDRLLTRCLASKRHTIVSRTMRKRGQLKRPLGLSSMKKCADGRRTLT